MQISKNLLEKYNYPVPRYTSYPPANFFIDLNAEKYLEHIEKSNSEVLNHISFYIHIPFCKNLCFYCGCNMDILKEDLIEKYFESLFKELEIVLPKIDKTRKLAQIHYGGGTPNAVNIKYIQKLNKVFFDNFETIENLEIAIELHPAFLDEKYIDELLKAKFNRVSIGVQDLNKEVLKNVNRLPSKLEIEQIVKIFRTKNPDININLDFIYGLPGQTIESFEKTIKEAVKLKPNRLVTFSYAHIPFIKSHQLALEKAGLCSSEEKAMMFQISRNILLENNYISIGLDHYVLEDDDLNKALSQKKLYRNFQGYCTRETTGQVYAFGVSAISQLDGGFFQNTKDLKEYIMLLDSYKLATKKGIILSEKEKIIGKVIEQFMCNYYLDLSEISVYFNISLDKFIEILRIKSEDFEDMINDDLLVFDGNIINITEAGKFFIRNIATKFDPAFFKSSKVFSKGI